MVGSGLHHYAEFDRDLSRVVRYGLFPIETPLEGLESCHCVGTPILGVLMRVVSWNVQGLGGPQFQRYRGTFQLELQRCLLGGQIDVLLLQEHHLSKSCTQRCGRLLGGQSSTFWVPAFGPRGVQGGVCMAIVEQWTTDILDSGTAVPG